jgi:hypothetical protein
LDHGDGSSPGSGHDIFQTSLRKEKMRKFFLFQSGVILVLIYIQKYVQEGTTAVGFQTLGAFIVLLSLTLALSVLVMGVRKLLNRRINFADGVLKISIFVLPIYYVAQLVGWLYDQGIIGGK